MAVTTTPSVTLFAYGVAIDLTSRTLGVNVSTRAPLGQLGETTGFIEFDNTDGAMTPGGGGTYSTTDWFSHAIQLDAEVTDGTTTHDVALAHGIITGFEIRDDGVTSFVRMTFDDGFTVGGGSETTIEFDPVAVAAFSPVAAISRAYRPASASGYTFTGAQLPALGHPEEFVTVSDPRSKTYTHPTFGANWEPTDAQWDIEDDITFKAPAKDFLNTNAMPSGPFTAYPTVIETFTFSGANFARYRNVLLGPWTIRDDQTATVGSGYRYDFTFDETPGSDELPFRETVRRYNSDELINSVRYTSLPTSGGVVYDVTAENEASVVAYGSRARYVSQGLAQKDTLTVPDPFMWAVSIANRYANMTADATYHLHQIETSAKMVESLTQNSVDAWAHLLDIRDGLYQYTEVNYTPTGAGSQQTVSGVIYSRTLNVTPSDVSLVLELYPRGVLAGFILNDAVVGVLDQDMLG